MVEFNVAITIKNSTETKGGVGIFIGAIGLGSQGKSEEGNSTLSTIKFSVPVDYSRRES
jgi:hypothetical protein